MSPEWTRRLFAVDQPTVEAGDALGEVAQAFHGWQVEHWPRLADATRALDAARTRELEVGERQVLLQWNPGRRVSTTAKVDERSLRRRPCFLCEQHLPPEQKGIDVGNGLVLLANPAPILPLHVTISYREHRPQALSPVLGDAIRLAAAFAGVLTVSYNGPRCGASAPDHLHLQAVAGGRLPDELEINRRMAGCVAKPPGRPLVQRSGLRAWCNRESSRALLILAGTAQSVEHALQTAVETLAELSGGGEEPPLNLLVRADDTTVTAMLYPRGAHRPSCYFAEGDEQILVSPGALDVAGLVVTVRRSDFQRLDEQTMGQIFRETSLDESLADELEPLLCRRLGAEG